MTYFECRFPPYSDTQKLLYTYKALIDIKPGDFAVVETPTNGFQVVEVVAINERPKDGIKYKYLMQKVDFSEHKAHESTIHKAK